MSRSTWIPAYIGVGSNLDTPERQVALGINALAGLPRSHLITSSHLYRSKPLGPQDQPDFVNAVAGLLTQLEAHVLLDELKALEIKLGREDSPVRWGPRKIDFDILVFGSERISSGDLQIPHAGLPERGFVIVPLAEIAPDLDVPGVGRLDTLLERTDTKTVTPL